ncbi:MAG TPA: hypothetical protein VH593_29715 [Ktedonobacteraceae bacterium]|jgi:predicted DNA-binding protein
MIKGYKEWDFKFTARLPKQLHQRLVKRSTLLHRPLNKILLELVEQRLDQIEAEEALQIDETKTAQEEHVGQS